MEYSPPIQTAARILCCECGVAIEPNAANMCMNCISSRVDITEGIPKQIVVNFCRGCERYLQPPAQWLSCQLESKELLALLLRKIKGLSKVRLIDAGFVWTEPHSKRIKVKVTIQKEAFTATILQQTFVIEATVAGQQCMDCARREAKNMWNTVVQVRQKVLHKRTFLYLEQLILKHRAHRDTVNIKNAKEGLDFYFNHRNHGVKFVDFLQAVVPVRMKTSEQLVSHDTQSGDSSYKHSFSVEIIPICKDDLVMLPPKIAKSLGGLSPLLLCSRVGTTIHFVDPVSLETADVITANYWRDPFTSLASSREATKFYVLDVELTGRTHGKWAHADIQVARESDFGKNSTTFHCRSHLGNILKAGDIVLGYDMVTSNFNNADYDAFYEKDRNILPDIVLVKKSYDHLRKDGKRRKWKLKQLAMDVDEDLVPTKATLTQQERDRELFMQDLEEDEELRETINLYRDSAAMMVSETEAEDEIPRIPLEDLLDDLTLETNNDEGEGEDAATESPLMMQE